ncbi:hypothetical protein P171DRAFT_27522 [Karstenula rhodostoma CBS 690.94]|uniref:Nephrocystin 3-like N-terminal domain-containing protein n=1 Tax=Karstenula rhodostoma CBS 690.94 TaxID=1392251 RepID=A0A9P4PFN9_9PLEO|nr:hypothetical protein P171DRAFT_27522 [Karstenula rhodostoma CBS 690.94]
MCASIVDTLNQMSSKDDPIVVVKFFFDFRARDHQDACAFLSSMLVQIQKAKCEVLLKLSSLHGYHSKLSQPPSEVELLNALRIVLLEQNRVYTIIDGLDECRVHGRVIETLEEICKWQMPHHQSKLSANFYITNSCLLYLQYFDRMQQSNPTSYTHLPLYPYCISHWFHHYKFSNRPAELTVHSRGHRIYLRHRFLALSEPDVDQTGSSMEQTP